MIDFQNVSFQYVPRDHADRGCDFDPATHRSFSIEGFSLRVEAGERVLLCAQNGGGKSTCLSLMAGKRMPRSGTARVLGRDSFNDTTLQRDVALIGAPWPSQALFSCSVGAVVSPCEDEPRRDALAAALHLPMQAQLNKMSSGQKRRVQILHGLMTEKKVILMDECSTDIDVAERVTLMNFVRRECETKGACCVYATHILDGVEDWATRIVVMDGGRIVRDEPFDASKPGALSLESRVSTYLMELEARRKGIQLSELEALAHYHANGVFRVPDRPAAAAATAEKNSGSAAEEAAAPLTGQISAADFTFRDLFANITHTIPRGRRVLLCACNAAGKTTVLELLAGHTFFANKDNQLTIAGRPCFQDTKLHNVVAFGGHWWAQVPPGQMQVREMVTLPLDARAEQLRQLLNVDLDWDVRHVSTGELKRVQLLMKMAEFKPVILMDESTADLDIHMRANLLRFLYEESECRGVTIVYATHIFEGLGEWPSDVLLADRSTRNWTNHRVERGEVLVEAPQKKEDAGDEAGSNGAATATAVTRVPLRQWLVASLIALKGREDWQKWFV